jgi:predicted metalloprotease with PDZ domain
MVHYTFGISNPSRQYIQIQVVFELVEDEFIFRLPAWRPGRYELGNFAKNIKGLKVFNDKNKRIDVEKIEKDAWKVNASNTSLIRVDYAYYAAELNAGSTFLSNEQLYINPVNCCIYADSHSNESVRIQLNIPENWEIATSMDKEDVDLIADNFDELADSPLICSAGLQHQTYEASGVLFHVWFNGEVKPNWDRLLNDFKAFSEKQIEKFIEFPVKEYHFLIQIRPFKAYHGVEHCKSTVITLGPSYDVFGSLYKELLGVSSHELYHTWNVKAIRPESMFPYDFSKENYSRLGYLYEGVTTYMGDLFLLKSGVFPLQQYLVEFKNQLQKHFDNQGRFNYSVADSSFDTWLDGYVPGAPARKVSIYTEGCLIAFVLDCMILQASGNKKSLDDVLRQLYFNFALAGKGVREENYLEALENVAGISFKEFFEQFVHGTNPFESILTTSLNYIGFELQQVPSSSYAAGRLGCKVLQTSAGFSVGSIFYGSPADLGGLMIGDEIIAVNGYACQTDLESWLRYFESDEKELTFLRQGRVLQAVMPEVDRYFFSDYSIVEIEDKNNLQLVSRKAWMS